MKEFMPGILTLHLGLLLLLPLLKFTLEFLQLLLVRVLQDVHDSLWEWRGQLAPPPLLALPKPGPPSGDSAFPPGSPQIQKQS